MYFAVICEDKPMMSALRSQTRPHHLRYLEPYLGHILFAGPLLEDTTEASVGGLIVIDLPSHEAAREFARNDPYALVGLFARIDVRLWRKVIPG